MVKNLHFPLIMMLLAVFLFSFSFPQSVEGSSEWQGSQVAFEIRLSTMAKDEMQIVSRLRSLREATEKLPESWKAKSTPKYPEELSKADLLDELAQMELSAAERWTLLLNNLAHLKEPSHSLSNQARAWRESLKDLPGLQMQIHVKLDGFNSRLKDGILMNLAKRLHPKTTESPDEIQSASAD